MLPVDRLAPALVWPLLLLLWSSVSAARMKCPQSVCDRNFQRSLDVHKALTGSNARYCLFLQDYRDCLLAIKDPCRGNLRYHSMTTLSKRFMNDFNCTAIISEHIAGGGKPLEPWVSPKRPSDGPTFHPPQKPSTKLTGRCLYPYDHRAGPGEYRHCGVFGDPHLRTFDGQQETCRTAGAWPLIDNAFLAVQVTNDPVGSGISATAITKVTVIIRSLTGCTDQKTFEATQADLPSAFVDGSTQSPSSHLHSKLASTSPSVYIKTVVPGEHIEIILRYIATTVTIRRVGGYLSFAIRLPHDVIQERSSVSLQLCLTGCPAGQRIEIKEVLGQPEVFLPSAVGLSLPRMDRSEAVEICRDAGAVDFYFDSCVFDLMITGDPNFSIAAVRALSDVRTLYPPYREHYELNRTDLQLYDSLAKAATPHPRLDLTTQYAAASRSSATHHIPSVQFLLILGLLVRTLATGVL